MEAENCGRPEWDSEGSSSGDVVQTEMQPIHDGRALSAPLEVAVPSLEAPDSLIGDGAQRVEIVVQNPVTMRQTAHAALRMCRLTHGLSPFTLVCGLLPFVTSGFTFCLAQWHKNIDQAQPPRTNLSLGILLDYVSVMSNLAFFCMIGVAIRYLLEIGLGPTGALLTDDMTPIFRDIPANVLGCFIMGWVGVVVKKHLVHFNEPLAVGLSTGLCGSLTTFAAWNQMILQMVAAGFWLRGIFTYFSGVIIAQGSLQLGIDTANGFLAIVARAQHERDLQGRPRIAFPTADHMNRRWGMLMIFFTASALLWTAAAAGTAVDTGSVVRRKLFLSVLVGPFGVWTRWYLARLNGRGVGRKQHLKWLPMGTLTTNLVAAWLEAALSTVNRWETTPTGGLVIASLDLGMMGSMSTVSTFVVELRSLHQASSKQWRAYAYFLGTVFLAFLGGVLIFNVPVWVLKLAEYQVY